MGETGFVYLHCKDCKGRIRFSKLIAWLVKSIHDHTRTAIFHIHTYSTYIVLNQILKMSMCALIFLRCPHPHLAEDDDFVAVVKYCLMFVTILFSGKITQLLINLTLQTK